MNITRVVLEADSSSIKAATKDLNALQGSGQQAEKSVTGLGTAAKAAGTLIAGLAASFSIREVIQYADEWQNASNRLRLVTSSSKELAETQQILLRVANDTRAGFSSTAELFTVLTRSTQDLGLSQSEIVDITKTLNQTFAIAGGSATSMDGAIRQLSQGLQSGALRGDEFNSVAEQAPGILDAVAASLKMGRGELREFAATGGITSQVLIKAIKDYADVIESDFAKAQRTFGQSLQEARNNALEFVGSSKLVQQSTSAAGDAVVVLSKNLDVIAVAAAAVATVITARMIASITTSTIAWVASTQQVVAYELALARMAGVSATTAASQTALSSALALVGGPVGALIIAAGALVYFVSKMESATESTARMIDELDTLHRGELQRGIEIQKTYIQGIETQIERMSMQNQSVAAVRERMAELRTRLEEATKDLQRMNNGMRDIEERDFEGLVAEMTGGMLAYSGATNAGANSTEVFTRSTNALVNMMDSAADASYNTASAYVQLMGTFGSVIPSIDQVTTRTTRLTEEQKNANLINRDAQDSIDGIVDSMEKQKEVSPQLVEVTNLMRNDISSAFADMMMNGGNAFDSIAKSFERMIYKMIADWAASKIMNVIGEAVGISGLGGTSALGSIASAISSGGTSGGVGSVISGGGSAAGTASNVAGVAGGVGAAIAGAGSVFGTAGAVASAAEVGMLTGGATVGAGGSIGAGLAAGIKGLGAGAMSILSAIPGWGWALGGAALVAKLLDDSGTMSSNSGILLSDLPGVAADRKRDTPAYASGVDPVLFARRDSFDNAMQISEALRAADSAVMELFGAAGKSFSITGPELSAFDEKGGGFGQFFGVAAEDGKVALTAQQSVEKYVRELISAGNRYTGSSIAVSGSVDNMLMQLGQGLGFDGSNANGLDYVPFDGYRSILHQGEAVITAKGNDALGMMASALTEMRTIMAAVAQHTAKSARQLERWDFGGLPEERAFA